MNKISISGIALRNATSQLAIAAAVAICGLLFERFGFHAVAYFAAGCSVAASGLAWRITEPETRVAIMVETSNRIPPE